MARLTAGRLRDSIVTRLEYGRRRGRDAGESRVVSVLGMHRSGTSALAGTLQQAGLYLGPVLRKHDSNRRGTRENLEIVKLHDAILEHSGGSWRSPPRVLTWTDEHRAWRDRIVRALASAGLWGFKDPRTVLLLDFWREALGDRLTPVGTFRAPGPVVASLLERDGGTPDAWFALWTRHNEALLDAHADRPFPIVEYVSDADAYRAQTKSVLEALGLRATGRTFFDPRLPTAGWGEQVPADADALFARLHRLVDSG